MTETDFLPFDPNHLKDAISDAWNAGMLAASSEARFPQPRVTPLNLIRVISSFVSSTLAELARQRNLSNPFIRLPMELLATVFAELSVADRLAAAMVCRPWHNSVFGSPRVWTSVYCRGTQQSAVAMVEMLRLSAQSSIRLSLLVSGENSETAINALNDCLPRCSHLELMLEGTVESHPDVREVLAALEQPAPKLRSFWLHDPGMQYLNLDIAGDLHIFGGHAPQLRSLLFNCDVSTLALIDPAGLATAKNVFVCHPTEMNSYHLMVLFRLVPKVVHLLLRVQQADGAIGDKDPIDVPPSLRSLDIVSELTESNAWTILKHLRWQHIHRVSLQPKGCLITEAELLWFFNGTTGPQPSAYSAWIDWEDDLADMANGVTLYISDIAAEDPHVLLPRTYYGPEPSVSVPERSSFELVDPLPASLFLNVTRLYLNELVFDPDCLQHPLPPLPAVVDLKIRMTTAHFIRHNLGVSPFVVQHPDDKSNTLRTIHCPVLQTFSLTAGRSDYGIPQPCLTPRMVTDFIRAFLRYERAQLAHIRFYGIDLLVVSTDDFEDMLSFAEQTDWEHRYMSWAANLDCYEAMTSHL